MNAPAEFDLHRLIERGAFSAAAFKGESQAPEFIDSGKRFPVGEAGVMAGEGGIGKSFAALRDMEKAGMRDVPCIAVFSEDSWANVDRRLKIVRSNLGISKPHDGSFYITTQALPADCRVMAFNQFTNELTRLPMFDFLKIRLDTFKAQGRRSLVYLDNLTSLFSIDPNKAEQAGPVMLALNQLASETDACVIALHHLTKGDGKGDQRARIRGSGGIVDQSRFAFVMTKAADDVAKYARTTLNLPADAEIVTRALVKSNGPLNRIPVHYVRQGDGFLLRLPDIDFMSNEDALVELIRSAAAKGVRYTKSGQQNGLYPNRHDGWPGGLGKLGRNAMQWLAASLIESGRLTADDKGFLCATADA